MKFQDEFRDSTLVQSLAKAIVRKAAQLNNQVNFMEVCGTHTMAIARFGLKSLLPESIRLISGPGCPVCVTPISYIDQALLLAERSDTILTTFGDLMRVPGSQAESLMNKRAAGADVRIVYSALDAVRLASDLPGKQVVFLGVGFETTTPTIAAAIIQADKLGLRNFSVLTSHKTMPAPMLELSRKPGLQLSGYLCPAHVSTVIGSNAYLPISRDCRIPCVVTGFEPADILQGVSLLLDQRLKGISEVENQYTRAVTSHGNQKAQQLINTVFEPADAVWRGLGSIPESGLKLRPIFHQFDACKLIPASSSRSQEPAGCRCGEILTGQLSPQDCPLFDQICTPETPVGACMVSSEGSCAAAWKYGDR